MLEEEEGVSRQPDGGIQVCLEATHMIPHPKTIDGGKAGVDGKCVGGAARAMRMSHPLLTLGGTEAQEVTGHLKPQVDARRCESM